MKTLLDCPFCGNDAVFVTNGMERDNIMAVLNNTKTKQELLERMVELLGRMPVQCSICGARVMHYEDWNERCVKDLINRGPVWQTKE